MLTKFSDVKHYTVYIFFLTSGVVLKIGVVDGSDSDLSTE